MGQTIDINPAEADLWRQYFGRSDAEGFLYCNNKGVCSQAYIGRGGYADFKKVFARNPEKVSPPSVSQSMVAPALGTHERVIQDVNASVANLAAGWSQKYTEIGRHDAAATMAQVSQAIAVRGADWDKPTPTTTPQGGNTGLLLVGALALLALSK